MNSYDRIESIHFGHSNSVQWQADVEKCFKVTQVENLSCDYTYFDQTDKGCQLRYTFCASVLKSVENP